MIADVHGNLHALREVLSFLDSESVDAYICAGDLVGYGAFPNECVEIVAALNPICVAGNHDLMVLGRLSTERCIPLARRTLAWTQDILAAGALGYLASLPLRARADGIVVAHGSLDDPEDYSTRPEQAERQLSSLDPEQAGVLVLGHTHRPWCYGRPGGTVRIRGGRVLVPLDERGRYLLNPGAVGQSREMFARARCLVLDLQRREARFFALEYDLRGYRRALRDRGLPSGSYHLPPSPFRASRRVVSALSRRMRRIGRPRA